MPKRIVILDPNGVEVAREVTGMHPMPSYRGIGWEGAVIGACGQLEDLLKRENPKLGTYTVTVKEVE